MYDTEHHGAPTPGSPAATEAAELDDLVGEHYEDPGGTNISIVASRMWAANDHLHGVAHLLTPKDTGYLSTWATGRACLEMLAGAHRMSDPSIDHRERLGRVINERLHSLRGATRLIAKGEIGQDDIQRDPEGRHSDLLERAAKIGFTIVGTGVKRQVDPPRPSATDLVDGLTTGGIYSLFSGMSHGEIWAMAHFQEEVPGYEDPSGLARRMSRSRVTVQEYQSLVSLLADAHHTTVTTVSSYLGWETGDYEASFKRTMESIHKPV